MERHNPTLREWVTEQVEGLKRSSDNESSRAALGAFEQTLRWLDENKVDVQPGFAERYASDMRFAEGVYADVVFALREAGHEASVTQTGGMCLAITWPANDGSGDYFLLTDKEDVLSWERRPEQGWALGRYPGGEDADDTAYFVEVCPLKHAATAVLMANSAHRGARQ